MAELRPFRGIHYDREVVGDLSRVICPPYDIITDEQRSIYRGRSRYNAILLEQPLPFVEGSSPEHHHDGYGGAAAVFRQWLGEGVLRVDDCPAFYLHDYHFAYQGRRVRRRGLTVCVSLQPWYGGVYPHEQTTSKAKRDRLELMRACRASFSPILALYEDSDGDVAQVLHAASGDAPLVEFGDAGERHVVWAVTEPELTRRIRELMLTRSLYLADGHHRYETALAYQQEQGRLFPGPAGMSGERAFDYAMMTLVDFADDGLLVLPVHRLVSGLSESTLLGLENRLQESFALEHVPLSEGLVDGSVEKMLDGVVVGVLGLAPQSLVLLRPREDAPVGDMMPRNRFQEEGYYSLSLLEHVILDRTLGISHDAGDIAYSADVGEVYQQVREGLYQLAFLPSPPRLEMVRAVADAGNKMPRKSTYFWPKAPAGLVIYSLDWL